MISRHLVPFARRLAGYARLRRDAAELAVSGWVDAAWYRARNADLGHVRDPALHYLRRGAAEGRHPSAAFDGDAYCARYPDVEMSDSNPLLHYVRIGRREGRDVFPVRNDAPAPAPETDEPRDGFDESWEDIDPIGGCWPLVSVIIPSRDRADMLARCVSDVLRRTDYPSIEIILVDNASRSWRARHLLQRLRGDTRIQVLDFPAPFNWSAMNNAAARVARGEVLVLLNNDIRARQPGWLQEMARLALCPAIGVVGAKLLYPNGRVQHAGISLDRGAVARHVCRHVRADDPGPGGLLTRRRTVAAVTGACMAIRRELFNVVGGLEETHLGLTNGDIDLCLRVRARGLRVVCTPGAVLEHHEAATRGLDSTDTHRARLQREREYLVRTWGALARTDPHLPANLMLAGERLHPKRPGPVVVDR